MKTWLVLMCIAVMGVLVSSGAYNAHAQDNAGEPERQWGPATSGARFSISAERHEFKVSEPVKIEMTLENVGEHPMGILYGDFPYAYRFDIFQPNGQPAQTTQEWHRYDLIIRGVSGYNSIQPGNKNVQTIPRLNRFFDMTLAGEYTITIYRRVRIQNDDQDILQLQSNTLKITILGDIRDDVDEEFEAAEWGPVTRGVRMSIMLDKQKLRLRIITENVGEESVRIARISSDHSVMLAYRLDVRRADGIPLPLTLEGQRLRGERSATRRGTIKLDPGETDIYITPLLNRLFDMTTARRDYYVTIYRDIMFPDENPPWVEVQSNTLKTR